MNTTKYYLITGLDAGVPIKPFVVNTDNASLDFYLDESGDKARYYKPLTTTEYIELLEQELLELRVKEMLRE